MAENHYYKTGTYNGLLLHMIRTKASNITLKNLRCKQSLKESGYYGVNGGFFNLPSSPKNPGRVISLAKIDGDVVGPDEKDGNSNNWNGGGIIVWNGRQLSALFNEPNTDASDIPGTSARGTWAQGGISFWLGYSDYYDAVETGNGGTRPAQTSDGNLRARTAMVADMDTNYVYLIVTENECNYKAFRKAIQEYFDITDGSRVDSRYAGIMLDGGGSTQMKVNRSNGQDVELLGDGRDIAEVIVLKDET